MSGAQYVGWAMIAAMLILCVVMSARLIGWRKTAKAYGLILGGFAFYAAALYLIGTPP